MEEGNLIYFRDQRFLYLVDAATAKVRQRVRYSSFDRLVEFERDKMVVFQGFFCKVDEKKFMMELFQIKGNSVIDFKDLDLKPMITNTLGNVGLKYGFFSRNRMVETKDQELSVFCDISITWMAGEKLHNNNYWSVFYLDKETLEIKSMTLISEIYPKASIRRNSLILGTTQRTIFGRVWR